MAQKAHDLCSAADVAAELGVAVSAKVERAVSAASRMIAQHCGRVFERGTVTEYPRSAGRPLLLLSRPPIVAITSITELGAVVDADDYAVECTDAARDQGLVRHLSRDWADIRRRRGLVTETPDVPHGQSGSDGITVVYEGGFATPGQVALEQEEESDVPEDLQEAAIIAAVNLYRRLPVDQNIAAESLGDWSVTYRGELPGVISGTVSDLLAPYVLARAG